MNRLILLVLLFAGCGAARQNQTDTPPDFVDQDTSFDQRLHDIWVLKSITGVETMQDERRPRLELFPAEKRMGGSGGCNEIFGQCEAIGNAITFSAIGSTKMFCRDLMDQEMAFIAALQQVDSYTIQKLELHLYIGGELAMVLMKVD